MSHSLRRALSILVCSGALASTACRALPAQTATQTPTAQANRIAAQPDLHATTRLAGHVPAWATAAQDAGAPSSETSLSLTFVLTRSPDRQAAFEQMLAAQQTPASPSYHHWLTPQQIGSLYGPTQHDLAAFTGWLTGQGFAVTDVAPTGVFVTAQAPVSTVSSALSVSFRLFTLTGPDGTPEARPRIAATTNPAIPAAFAALIRSITGLADTPVYPAHSVRLAPMPAPHAATGIETPAGTTTGGTHLITPNDFAVLYNLNPLYKAGFTGTGQRVAIVGRSRVLASDISTYETLTGLPAVQPTVIIPPAGTDPGITNTSDQDEATLDVDRVIGTAPGAGVDLIVSANTNASISAVQLAAQYAVTTVRDPILNISFSACEANAGSASSTFWDNLFAVAAGEGISSFVSSGDTGAAGCQTAFKAPSGTQVRSINVICASSYATCVGGTGFADFASPTTYWSATNGPGLESALSYIPEGAWNEPTGSGSTPFVLAATGGGPSTFIPKPSWQTGTGVPSDGFRDTPDVSFAASGHDGYLACLAYSGGDCVKNIAIFSGTSASAPGMAGIAALLNQKKAGAQGNLNPLLYGLAASTSTVFHDATPATSGVATCDLNTASMCNNSTPSASAPNGGLAGFALTPGYDEATGLGSLDASNLVAAAVSSPTIQLTAASDALTVTAGSNTGNTDALTLASSGFTGPVTFTCTVAYVGTGTPGALPICGINPATVTLATGGTATSLLTLSTASQPKSASQPGKTTAAITALLPPASHPAYGRLAFASLFLLTLLPLRRRIKTARALASWQTLPIALLLLCGLGGLLACSGSSTPANPNPLLVSASTTTVAPAQATIAVGASDTFTATVVNSGFNTTVAPTGTVQFILNGTTPVSTATLAAGSATSAAIPFNAPGTYAISASYSGDANFKASSSNGVPFTVTSASTTPGAYTVVVTAIGSGGITATHTIALTVQ